MENSELDVFQKAVWDRLKSPPVDITSFTSIYKFTSEGGSITFGYPPHLKTLNYIGVYVDKIFLPRTEYSIINNQGKVTIQFQNPPPVNSLIEVMS